MKYSEKKISSFGKIFGGKSRYARQYISLFPSVDDYNRYVEPFAGGAGILMNKERSQVEILNDFDPCIYNVLYRLKNDPKFVISTLQRHYGDYSEETFQKAKKFMRHNSPVHRAAAYIAANRMSRSGLFKDFAWSERTRGGKPGDQNAWENFIHKNVYDTVERLQNVELFCSDAIDVIQSNSNQDTLFYLDPPYLHSTRVTKKAYIYEYTTEDHVRLLKLITKRQKAKFFLSGYDSPLYREYLSDWKVHGFHRPSDAGQTRVKTRRVELVWESP